MAKLKGTEQLIKNLSRYEQGKVRRIVNTVQAVQAMVVNDARKRVPVDTSTLLKSIMAGRIELTPRTVQGEVTAEAEYASFIEFTVKPHFPPLGALKEWAARKLGDESAAFPIAKKMAAEGFKTLPKPFMGPAVEANKRTFHRLVARAMLS